jgi:hypothetical protein
MTNIKVLTVRQPWADAILQLGKDVENRVWNTNYRGKIYIHASQRINRNDILQVNSLAKITNKSLPQTMITGAILGHVELTDIVKDSQSRWALPNQYNWLLTNPVLLNEPIYCKGKLSLWNFEL